MTTRHRHRLIVFLALSSLEYLFWPDAQAAAQDGSRIEATAGWGSSRRGARSPRRRPSGPASDASVLKEGDTSSDVDLLGGRGRASPWSRARTASSGVSP